MNFIKYLAEFDISSSAFGKDLTGGAEGRREFFFHKITWAYTVIIFVSIRQIRYEKQAFFSGQSAVSRNQKLFSGKFYNLSKKVYFLRKLCESSLWSLSKLSQTSQALLNEPEIGTCQATDPQKTLMTTAIIFRKMGSVYILSLLNNRLLEIWIYQLCITHDWHSKGLT
jgi:hypothetical protein